MEETNTCPGCKKTSGEEAWPFCSTACKRSYLRMDEPVQRIDRTKVCSLCLFTAVEKHEPSEVVLCDSCAGYRVKECPCCEQVFKTKVDADYCEICENKEETTQ